MTSLKERTRTSAKDPGDSPSGGGDGEYDIPPPPTPPLGPPRLEDYHDIHNGDESFGFASGIKRLAVGVKMGINPIGILHLARWRLRTPVSQATGFLTCELMAFTGVVPTSNRPTTVLAISEDVLVADITTDAAGEMVDFAFTGVQRIKVYANSSYMLVINGSGIQSNTIATRRGDEPGEDFGRATWQSSWLHTASDRAHNFEIWSSEAVIP